MEVRLICKIEPPYLLFLIVFFSFYISRYHFSQIFRASFCIICKKDFCHKFSFLMDSLKPQPSPPPPPPYPINSQNSLTVMKVFCQCFRKYLLYLIIASFILPKSYLNEYETFRLTLLSFYHTYFTCTH